MAKILNLKIEEQHNQAELSLLSIEEMNQVCGGEKIAVPIDGTEWHTDTDCCQMWEIKRSFLGIKLKSHIVAGGCSHMNGNCIECCETCPYIAKIGI